MSVAKGRRQFVIVDRPAALAGRPADWRETSLRPPLSATEWIVGDPYKVSNAASIDSPSEAALSDWRVIRPEQDSQR